jgi:hypothetical protein
MEIDYKFVYKLCLYFKNLKLGDNYQPDEV